MCIAVKHEKLGFEMPTLNTMDTIRSSRYVDAILGYGILLSVVISRLGLAQYSNQCHAIHH
jgi:hypothetical protein